ncbi:glutaminase A (plasmid) [Frondihabitans sp. PAMC 28766]|uniref:glutaminase A n=1 Tax=Frondihabitans sp. PAMC 28766 TaxID=1795630 RepID=UPI00078C6494|nr:glutaminase A [Frondihabitans sp. PAMC 28766]AMM22934.1 glutaminase A [Frondihabitans sp. PAMC 28766]
MLASDAIATAVANAWIQAKDTSGGANANYIPALATVDPTLFGISVVTTGGDTFTAGDATVEFAIESISKVVSMALAMDAIGAEEFHGKVGTDPTGLPFNSVMALALHGNKPMSALVNAGAMSATSLIPAESAEHRWVTILEGQSTFAGRQLTLSDMINDSEQATNAHNKGIAWLLQAAGYLHADPMGVCDVYTRQCSTLITTTDLAVIGATLANGGINPTTQHQAVTADNVPHILAEMTMEGLYESSGDWAYSVGLPGKSGVGGGLVAVVPGVLAIAAYSPPLDERGNSVRAQQAITQITRTLNLSLYRNGPRTVIPEPASVLTTIGD